MKTIFIFAVCCLLVGCSFDTNYSRINPQTILDQQEYTFNLKNNIPAFVKIDIPDVKVTIPGSSTTIANANTGVSSNGIQTYATSSTIYTPPSEYTVTGAAEEAYIENMLNESLKNTNLFEEKTTTFFNAKRIDPSLTKEEYEQKFNNQLVFSGTTAALYLPDTIWALPSILSLGTILGQGGDLWVYVIFQVHYKGNLIDTFMVEAKEYVWWMNIAFVVGNGWLIRKYNDEGNFKVLSSINQQFVDYLKRNEALYSSLK